MNKRILAAQLRANATQIDRLAWKLEDLASRPYRGDARLLELVNGQRKVAKRLRVRADELAPKKVKA